MLLSSQTIPPSQAATRPSAMGCDWILDGAVWMLALLLSLISISGRLLFGGIGLALAVFAKLSVYVLLIVFFAVVGILIAGICIISLGTISLS